MVRPEAVASHEAIAAKYPPARDTKDGCPLNRAIEQIADKWKLRILVELARDRVIRFRELQRRLEPVSQKVLTSALRELESDGLITRTVYAEVPPRVEYRPTPRSEQLLVVLEQLHDWAAADEAQLELAATESR
jgi:DNA-binding HxlR family transcriptional regulator